MRISDWSSDVCSSDLILARRHVRCALGHIDLDLEVVEVFGARRDVYLEPIIIAHARRSPRPCDSTSFPLCSTYGYRANPFRSRRPERRRAGARPAPSRQYDRARKDRKRVVQGKRVYVREALGGRRIINKKQR